MRAKPVILFSAISLGIFLLGFVLFNYFLMPLFIHQHNTVRVPDLRALSEKHAVKELSDLSLDYSIARREHNEEVPDGFVISQSPRADESVKEGRTVLLVMSLGAKMQRVPDIGGLSLRQSRIVLARNQFKIGRVSKMIQVGDTREMVIATAPGPGIELMEGETVDILVSVGGRKPSYLMPDFSGQDLLFIRDKLEQMGFRVASVRYEYRDDVYPNTIIDQSPRSGIQIREGDSIELVAATTN
jgi:beta-lactam-binding protein with PASTA domain